MKHKKQAERLRKIVEAFPNLTITVLADLVADEFVFGEIARVSREAPVLILKHCERAVVPGGASSSRRTPASVTACAFPQFCRALVYTSRPFPMFRCTRLLRFSEGAISNY